MVSTIFGKSTHARALASQPPTSVIAPRYVHIAKRLLHALADAGIPDWENSLSSYDEVDIRNITKTAEDANIVRELHSAPDAAICAYAKIKVCFVLISTAERTQLDGGVQDNNIECSIRQMQVKGLGADEIDTLVGGSFISPLLSVELESIAKAVNNGCVRADDTNPRWP